MERANEPRDPHRHPRGDRLHMALGIDPDELRDALREVDTVDLPEQPSLDSLRAIDEAFSLPQSTGHRVLRKFEWRKGDPQHGAMPSHAHISRLWIDFKKDCPECGGDEALFDYHAYGNEAVGYRIECVDCRHEHEREEHP